MPVKVLFCYAHEDEKLLNRLKKHLRPLKRAGLIEMWYDREILAGSELDKEIDKHLTGAQIVLLLVSADFLDSDYCYEKEMTRAIERHKRKEAKVIPIILRPCRWQSILIGELLALPNDGVPVVSHKWNDLDEALDNIAEGLEKVVKELASETPSISSNTQLDQDNTISSTHLYEKSPVNTEISSLIRYNQDTDNESISIDKEPSSQLNRSADTDNESDSIDEEQPSQDTVEHLSVKSQPFVAPRASNLSQIADDPYDYMGDEMPSRLPHEQHGSVSIDHIDTDKHEIQEVLDTSTEDDDIEDLPVKRFGSSTYSSRSPRIDVVPSIHPLTPEESEEAPDYQIDEYYVPKATTESLQKPLVRRSPLRHMNEDDPLHTQNDVASKSGVLSTLRPDPRRTRQLLRQKILADKRHFETGEEEIDAPEPEYIERSEQEIPYNEGMMSQIDLSLESLLDDSNFQNTLNPTNLYPGQQPRRRPTTRGGPKQSKEKPPSSFIEFRWIFPGCFFGSIGVSVGILSSSPVGGLIALIVITSFTFLFAYRKVLKYSRDQQAWTSGSIIAAIILGCVVALSGLWYMLPALDSPMQTDHLWLFGDKELWVWKQAFFAIISSFIVNLFIFIYIVNRSIDDNYDINDEIFFCGIKDLYVAEILFTGITVILWLLLATVSSSLNWGFGFGYGWPYSIIGLLLGEIDSLGLVLLWLILIWRKPPPVQRRSR